MTYCSYIDFSDICSIFNNYLYNLVMLCSVMVCWNNNDGGEAIS